MIATLEGILAENEPLRIVLQVGGVGYEVHIPLTAAERLPATGDSVRLYIHSVYREDSAALYGFLDRDDRDFFRTLLDKVSGIGPRIALNILSRMTGATLRRAIADGDIATLSKCQGIGKKTAERLVIELKDSALAHFEGSHGGLAGEGDGRTEDRHAHDAVAALIALGFKASEAEKAIGRALKALPDPENTEALVKFALQ